MTYTVSITSQGQMSIPAPIRKKYQLDKAKVATVSDEGGGRIVVQPVPDIMDFAGIFKTKKKIPFKKTRKAFIDYLATRHIKRGNFPFPHISPR